MNLIKSLRSAAVAVALLSAGAANAGLYQFNLTGDYTASWQLDSEVVPDSYGSGQGFILWDVEGNFPGSWFDVADLTFYNASQGGGLEIYDFWSDTLLVISNGAQLYSGKESGPSFRLGSFGLTEFGGSGSYTLTVTDLDAVPGPSPVPEPATTAMLLGGLGMLYVSRKRRHGK